MYEDNVRLQKYLKTLPLDFTYEEHPGHIHNWTYWDMMIQKVLSWLPL